MNSTLSRAVTAALLLAALAGCSGTSDSDDEQSGGPSDAGTSAPVVTVTSVASLTGDLDQTAQDQMSQAVTEVVDGWLDAAYLGEFPRTDLSDAFADFTTGAAQRAQSQLDLMSNASLSGEASAVSRTVSLDVLAVGQKAVGVTATVDLVYGGDAADGEVTGSLDLTPTDAGWRVFGFEISNQPALAAHAESATATASEGADQ